MPHEHAAREPEHSIDPGSFMLGAALARLESKIDRLTHMLGQTRAQGVATHVLVERIAKYLGGLTAEEVQATLAAANALARELRQSRFKLSAAMRPYQEPRP